MDAEKLKEVIETKDINNEYYIELEGQLTKINESNKLSYLYTYNFNDSNELEYGVVANSFNDGTLDTLGLKISNEDIVDEMITTLKSGENTL